MTVVVWVFALVTAVVHIVVFVLEAFLVDRPAVYGKAFGLPADHVPAIRLWTFGVGFYNLFIGLGLVGGVVAWMAGYQSVGRTLVLYLLAFTFLSGLVLLVADRMALSRPRGTGIGGAIGQSAPPLVALIAFALAQ
jgi:putative membrane protein